MQTHLLSKNAKRALTLLLTLAIMLPLFALLPRYLDWQERRTAQRALDASYTASVSDTLSR